MKNRCRVWGWVCCLTTIVTFSIVATVWMLYYANPLDDQFNQDHDSASCFISSCSTTRTCPSSNPGTCTETYTCIQTDSINGVNCTSQVTCDYTKRLMGGGHHSVDTSCSTRLSYTYVYDAANSGTNSNIWGKTCDDVSVPDSPYITCYFTKDDISGTLSTVRPASPISGLGLALIGFFFALVCICALFFCGIHRFMRKFRILNLEELT